MNPLLRRPGPPVKAAFRHAQLALLLAVDEHPEGNVLLTELDRGRRELDRVVCHAHTVVRPASGLGGRHLRQFTTTNVGLAEYESWKDLNDAFPRHAGRSRFTSGDGSAKKTWVNATDGSYTVPRIRQALKTLHARAEPTSVRHQDFDRLADLVKQTALTRRATPLSPAAFG